MKTTPTTEDRVWAVLSHLSALAFGMGILLPIIGWSEQRHKSRYASFQCLQALGYQSLGYTVWMLFGLVMLVLLVIVSALVVGSGGDDGRLATLWAAVLLFTLFGLLGVYVLFPVIAAVACGLGRDFRYPLMGNRLARYVGYETLNGADEAASLNEAHEDRWVAAMGHFSVIIPLWGLLAPVTAWILQGRQRFFLRSQSVQSTIFQSLVNIFYLGAGFIYIFGIIVLFAMTGLEGDPNGNSPMSMLGIVMFLISMLVIAGIMLVVPLFHILGQWAGYRVLKGDDYRYPVIGRLTEQWLTHKNPLTAEDDHLSLKGETV